MNESGRGLRRQVAGSRSNEIVSPNPFRVLIAAEDDNLRVALIASLAHAGFALDQVPGADAALNAVRQNTFDLVLLEMSKPPTTVITVCRNLRSVVADIGIVVVRASHDHESDLLALDAGADDCIAAPFRFRETVARLSAVLRQVREKPVSTTAVLRAGDLELDSERRQLFRAGSAVHLSPREFELLAFFMRNPEVAHTHIKLLRAAWGVASERDAGSLRSYVKSLRRKIEDDPARPEYIVTEPWVGYRFHIPNRLL
jgi:two-component system KDP operon response regulator KdpE